MSKNDKKRNQNSVEWWMTILPNVSPALSPETLNALIAELTGRAQLSPEMIESTATQYFRWLYQQIMDHDRITLHSPRGGLSLSISLDPGKSEAPDPLEN